MLAMTFAFKTFKVLKRTGGEINNLPKFVSGDPLPQIIHYYIKCII